jgi:hypothetical protein
MAKLSAAKLHAARVDRVENATLALLDYAERYDKHEDPYRRKELLRRAREYGAAVNRLGGRR